VQIIISHLHLFVGLPLLGSIIVACRLAMAQIGRSGLPHASSSVPTIDETGLLVLWQCFKVHPAAWRTAFFSSSPGISEATWSDFTLLLFFLHDEAQRAAAASSSSILLLCMCAGFVLHEVVALAEPRNEMGEGVGVKVALSEELAVLPVVYIAYLDDLGELEHLLDLSIAQLWR